MKFREASDSHYARLERAIIALEYALADARWEADDDLASREIGVPPAQEALQQAGEEVQDILAVLRSEALRAAASSAKKWCAASVGAVEEATQP